MTIHIDPNLDRSYSVLYDSSDHWAILTQRWGSLWPKVFPFCLLNGFIMIGISLLRQYYNINVAITTQGHSFVGVIVAFLLISRVNTALTRFNECRNHLSLMYRESREIISNMAAFTSTGKAEKNNDVSSKEWRLEVTYRTLLLLRTSMAMVDYPTDLIAAWDLPELSGIELELLKKNSYHNNSDVNKWAYEQRSEFEDNMRVPPFISYILKKSINSNDIRLPVPLTPGQHARMFGSVDAFLGGYYGIRKFMTTPVPFPLIQMARTFLFTYVFTIPFALLSDTSIYWAHWIEVFILTYGFAGLELVAIEMDNPFGDDDIDFDNLGLARICMEDAFLIVKDVDGEEWTEKLRDRMGCNKPGGGIIAAPTETTGLLA